MTQKIRIEDYKTPEFVTEAVAFSFQIFEDHTLVSSNFTIIKKGNSDQVFLHGENLEFISLKVDNELVPKDEINLDDSGLSFKVKNEQANIKIENKIFPHKNFALEGLYQSDKILCTQNEPEGFRKITYFFDRSDILCRYKTTISADKKKYPYLLSNGNLISTRDLDDGRHEAVWEDPFNKATYLFALVAGDLAKVTDSFTTRSGRKVALEFFVDFGNEDKCDHAIQSLKNAMKWDEDVYDLEYDLDIYMVVAVDSFNMGAMENKGLNIFNSAAVLANPKMATDDNFKRIESIVGHEYFHNWTGNRVTLRNWFELTLKEGLTVYRDQEFSAEMQDRVVQRIQDVNDLRNSQFIEDEGPMSHPIKPKEYEEINNFYTATVYNKGAEVIRMIDTIIGSENFKKAMDLYFERFDGKAVTTEDFITCMGEASGVDLTLFKNWYDESGTPVVNVYTSYDNVAKTFSLKLNQESKNRLLHIPLRYGFIVDGKNTKLEHKDLPNDIIHLKEKSKEYIFENVSQKPILSINRFFSSPVKINYELSLDDNETLAMVDEDLFNRAEAFKNLIKENIWQIKNGKKEFLPAVMGVIKENLKQRPSNNYLAEFLKVPSVNELNQSLETSDFVGLYHAREDFISLMAKNFYEDFLGIISELQENSPLIKTDPDAMGKRSLKNRLLTLISRINPQETQQMNIDVMKSANNMTDELTALMNLGFYDTPEANNAREQFGAKWKNESLVMDKWFSAISLIQKGETLKDVMRIEKHPLFDFRNPNKFRSLFGAFTQNHIHFHHSSGNGYKFIADKIIEIEKINPQVAARVLTSFSGVKKLGNGLKSKMLTELGRIKEQAKSKDVIEIASKYLA